MNKFTKMIGILMMTAILASACQSETKAPAEQNETKQEISTENTLIYGSKDYTSINPALYEHGEINALIFSGLLQHDKNNDLVPDLAKSWEYDDSTMTYSFELRDNVKWHDGVEFTADDVKFTLEAILDPENGSEIVSNYEDISEINVKSATKIDIVLKTKNVAMPDYLTIGILPKHLLENKDLATAEFNQKPVGTGPFELTAWDRGQAIVLSKNKDFYDGEPKLDQIMFKIVPDDNIRAMQLESGDIDFAQVTPKSAKAMEANDKLKFYDMKTADYRGIMYNFNAPLFKKHPEITNALSYGVDRAAILETVLLGKGEIAYSPLQKGEFNNPDIEKFEYNPQRAMELLEADDWIKNDDGIYEKDGDRLEFEINCMEGDQVRADMAMIAAQNLKDIGVNAKVSVKSDIDWDNQDSFLIGWGSPFDPDDHTYKVFVTDKGANYQYYSNKRVDEYLKKARETEDINERKEYYKEFQNAMTEKMPYTFFVYIDAIYGANKDIKGISENTLLGHHGVGVFWNIDEWEKIDK